METALVKLFMITLQNQNLTLDIFFKNKAIGAALLPIPNKLEDYLKGKNNYVFADQ